MEYQAIFLELGDEQEEEKIREALDTGSLLIFDQSSPFDY